MTLLRGSRIYPLCLLVGSLLVVVAAVLHPDLTGDGPAQLSIIARSDAWRPIHWAFLFGFVLSLTGLVGMVGRHAGTPGEGAARAGLIVGTLAYAAWMVIVTFMVGAAWTLARNFAEADPGLTATRAVFVYDMLHPFGLAAQRLAAFALGISTYLFGRAVIQGLVLPRWLGSFGIAAGAVGMALAVAFPETSKADEAAFVLPVLWQLMTAAVMLAARPVAAV